VPKDSQRFERLAAQFEMIAQDLSVCQNQEERRELLKGMILVLEQMADFCMNDHSLLDSKPDGPTPSNPLLSKAAHQ
jgi:hypothetical protein